MVTGDPKAIGEAFTTEPRIQKISFTGSTNVGKLLARNSADTLKKMTLELGGNAPFIVFDDVNLDIAVQGLVSAKLRNSGQVCISPNRVYVQSGIYDQFVETLKDVVSKIRTEQGMQDDFVVGPLINQSGVNKVTALVADATDKGARIVLGGKLARKAACSICRRSWPMSPTRCRSPQPRSSVRCSRSTASRARMRWSRALTTASSAS